MNKIKALCKAIETPGLRIRKDSWDNNEYIYYDEKEDYFKNSNDTVFDGLEGLNLMKQNWIIISTPIKNKYIGKIAIEKHMYRIQGPIYKNAYDKFAVLGDKNDYETIDELKEYFFIEGDD